MAVYTERLAAARMAAAATSLLFTTPEEGAYVIRDCVITNLLASSARISLVLWVPGTSSEIFLAIAPAMAAESTLHVDMRQRLEAADQLLLYHPDAPVSVAITGYHLS